MVTPDQLIVGRIVRLRMLTDPQGGNPKSRRALIVGTGQPDRFLLLVVAAIASIRSGTTSIHQVELPFRPDGHPQTSLTNPSAVICDWTCSVTISDIDSVCGYCPPLLLAEVLGKIAELDAARRRSENR